MGDGGGGHWLVRMEWCLARWSVCLPLLIFPCTIKSRSSFLAPAHPGGPGKRAIKRLWCDGVQLARVILTPSIINYGPQTLIAHCLPFQLLPNYTVRWQKHSVWMTCPKLVQSKLHHPYNAPLLHHCATTAAGLAQCHSTQKAPTECKLLHSQQTAKVEWVSWSLTSLSAQIWLYQTRKVRDGKLSTLSEGRLAIY